MRFNTRLGGILASVGVATVLAAGCSGPAASGSASAPAASPSTPTSSGTAETPTASATTGQTIAVLSPDYAAQPAAKTAIDLFSTEAKSRGYKVTIVDTNSDNAAMNGEITTAVSQGVDAIVIAFGTPQEFGEGLANAKSAGVPVFGLDTGRDIDPILANVTTDNQYLGETTAKAIIDKIGGTGNVVMIHFDPFEPVRLRAVAAKAAFEAAGINIVEYIQGDPANSTDFAKSTVLDMLTKYPKGELQAVWAGWDASALGAYQATQEANRSEVVVTGVDGQDFARTEVAKGQNWIATAAQDWPTIATKLTDIITDYFAGTKPTEATVFVPAVLITSESGQ